MSHGLWKIRSALDLHLQKVRRTTDARVVVADQMFAVSRGFGIVEAGNFGNIRPQVFLDPSEILRGWGHDLGLRDQAVFADPVAMVEKAPRGLGRVAAGAWCRLEGDSALR